MDRPVYVGIDLGTTNSAACVFDGEQLHSVRSSNGETLTPSVVRIDAKGNVSVGARARRFLNKDPENTRAEFKRLMGSRHQCQFQATALTKSPEELAALVLASLRHDVEAQLGVKPQIAVVAVPALFELPQIKATSEAARLAGFARIETIQEPVASALASGWSADESRGTWLVYDLGGGTFDASLLESQEGLLRVVGHDGDNFLGGRDFDLAVVDWLIAKLSVAGLSVERRNPGHAATVAKLKAAAEDVKIELSRARHATIVLEDLQVGDQTLDVFEETLSAEELDQITGSLIERSVSVCERLLKRHGVKMVERVVLVGGPTMMPNLRERLTRALGAPFGAGLDPMLLVAQGAALFAASAGLDARQPVATATTVSGPRLWMQYPAMTPDTSPFVVGRALEGSAQIKGVRFSRADGEWSSDWFPLDSDGTFSGMLCLKRRCAARFQVEAQLADGRCTSANPAEISLMHGVSIGEPPLSRTIGVALADNSVAVYFERGSPLPMRKTFTHRTVQAVANSLTDYALRVPVIQGDFPFAHLCRLVGVIEIPAASLKETLPANSVIELTLEVDRGGALTVKALVPAQGLLFDRVEQLVAPAASPEQMAELAKQLQARAVELRAGAFRAGERDTIAKLAEFESSHQAILRDLEAACGGDHDSAEKARRSLIDCDGLLGDLEAARAWPDLNARIVDEHMSTLHWMDGHSSDAERSALGQAMEQIQRAVRARNMREIERHLKTLRRLRTSAYLRQPDVWSWELDACADRVHESSDPRRAQELVSKARKAEQSGNRSDLERSVRELWGLLPGDAEDRALSFDSGVR